MPNLFLIGAPKAGTTYLFNVLSASPDIFSSNFKEPAYFLYAGEKIWYQHDKSTAAIAPSRNWDDYLELFSAGESFRYRLDGSTHYLSSCGTAAAIKAVSPDAKIIAILRDPVSRAYSHYLMNVRDGLLCCDFITALNREFREMEEPERLWSENYRFIRRSLYLEGVREFYQQFGNNFLLLKFKDVTRNLGWVVNELGKFLDLDLRETLHTKHVAEKNPFAVDRFPAVSRVMGRYRQSGIRDHVQAITPAASRRFVRAAYDWLRLRRADKPELPDEARAILKERLGDDYAATLDFAHEKNILKTYPQGCEGA